MRLGAFNGVVEPFARLEPCVLGAHDAQYEHSQCCAGYQATSVEVAEEHVDEQG